MPDYAIISAGKNNPYGHPAEKRLIYLTVSHINLMYIELIEMEILLSSQMAKSYL